MSYHLFKTKNFEKIVKELHSNGAMDKKDFDLEYAFQNIYSLVREDPEEYPMFTINIETSTGNVDAFGTSMIEGDRVVYTESGRYKYMRLGTIKKFSPKGVTIYIEGGQMTINRPTGKVIKYSKD